MLNDLPGKVAVVTGAGSGIGRSLVVALAAEGMRVVAADIEADALAGSAELVAGDAIVTGSPTSEDAAEVDALADLAYEAFGAVHLLCNNAGVFQGGVLWERTDAELDWVLGVNLWGILNGIRSFIPRMLAAGDAGHVVNTASMAGLVSLPFSGPYVVSKFAAVGVSESLAHDLQLIGAADRRVGPVPQPGRDRHRPVRPQRAGRPPRRRAVGRRRAGRARRCVDSTTGEGMSPDEVAVIVIEAVRSGQFYIGTKPSFDVQVTPADRRRARAPPAAMPDID